MRYLPLNNDDRELMRNKIGISNISELFPNITTDNFNLPTKKSEIEVTDVFNNYASKNCSIDNKPYFLGAGCYNHHIPATVDYIIQRSEFLTSYTPYQPEISQGTLMALFEFQTIIAMLTSQEVANASMYDGATSMTEAALMAIRVTRKNNIKIHNDIHPEYMEILNSYISDLDDVSIVDNTDKDTACVIVQIPDYFGNIEDIEKIRKECDDNDALLIIVTTEILSLAYIDLSVADIVAGEAQSIGVGLNFGGPHLGFFACKKKFTRQMPGRICGLTKDEDGRKSYVLTLNTREQHIRREKATSNICTNQGLCALAFTVHMSLLGEKGYTELAHLNHQKAIELHDLLISKNFKVINDRFFNEFTIELENSEKVVSNLAKKNIIAGKAEKDKLIIAVSELTKTEHMIEFVENLQQEVL